MLQVIKLEWFQPHGHHTGSQSKPENSPAKAYHHAHRRMLIVQQLETHCLAMYVALPFHAIRKLMLISPILTYNNQGCTKKGMKKSEIRQHAVIYEQRKESEPWYDTREQELGMQLPPIPVRLVGGQRLNQWSRVRFDNIHTVPHNYKVKDIGMVPKEHHPVILDNLYYCMFPESAQH